MVRPANFLICPVAPSERRGISLASHRATPAIHRGNPRRVRRMCARTATDTPQNLPAPGATALEGADVRARGWLWRVQRAWGAVGCQVIEIDPLHRDAPHIGALLDPFDRVDALPAGSRWRRAARGSLPQHIARLTGAWPDLPLAALGSMRVPLWTHQRAPALAIG